MRRLLEASDLLTEVVIRDLRLGEVDVRERRPESLCLVCERAQDWGCASLCQDQVASWCGAFGLTRTNLYPIDWRLLQVIPNRG